MPQTTTTTASPQTTMVPHRMSSSPAPVSPTTQTAINGHPTTVVTTTPTSVPSRNNTVPPSTTSYPPNVNALLSRLDVADSGVSREEFTIGTQVPRTTREIALAHKVLEQEASILRQDTEIKELQNALEDIYGLPTAEVLTPRSPRRPRSKGGSGSGSRGLQERGSVDSVKPLKKYKAVDRGDPIDVRLEEFYNSTNSVIPFKRINKGFYRFGDTTVEIKIVNQKLMVQTEDGWNRGKFGSIEKFMMCYENLEREKVGIAADSSQA